MESLIANQAVHFGAEMSAARSLKFTQSFRHPAYFSVSLHFRASTYSTLPLFLSCPPQLDYHRHPARVSSHTKQRFTMAVTNLDVV